MRDRVRNIGPSPAPHLMLYHINLGYPLIDNGSRLTLNGATKVWHEGDGAPLAPFGAPRAEQSRDISLHRWNDPTAKAMIAVAAASGLTLEIDVEAGQLPFCQVLRIDSSGHYGLSIEPCSTSARSRNDADDRGETRRLQPREEVRYDLSFSLSA